MLIKQEKLYYALVELKSVLNDRGIENIKSIIELKDGTIEQIDCYDEIEKCVVECINNTQS